MPVLDLTALGQALQTLADAGSTGGMATTPTPDPAAALSMLAQKGGAYARQMGIPGQGGPASWGHSDPGDPNAGAPGNAPDQGGSLPFPDKSGHTDSYGGQSSLMDTLLNSPLPETDSDPVGTMFGNQLGKVQAAQAKEYIDPATGKPYQMPKAKGLTIGGRDHPLDLPIGLAMLGLALSGRKGRQAAVGMGQGLLGMRSQQTAVANQNAAQQFQYEQAGRHADVETALGTLNPIGMMAYHQALVGARINGQQLQHEDRQALLADKDFQKLVNPATDPKDVPGILEQLHGRGIEFSQEAVAGFLNPSWRVKLGNAQEAVADERAQALHVATQYNIQANPIRIAGLQLKNGQVAATINNLNARSKSVLDQLPGKIQLAKHQLHMIDERANLYGVTASVVGPKAAAYMTQAYASAAHFGNLDSNAAAQMDLKTKQAVSSSLNSGISALGAELKEKTSALTTLQKEFDMTADDTKRQAIGEAMGRIRSEIDAVSASQKDLMGQAAQVRSSLGMNPDGSIPDKKHPLKQPAGMQNILNPQPPKDPGDPAQARPYVSWLLQQPGVKDNPQKQAALKQEFEARTHTKW